jgi:hypothetical protein
VKKALKTTIDRPFVSFEIGSHHFLKFQNQNSEDFFKEKEFADFDYRA